MAFLVRQGEKCQNRSFLAASEPSGSTRLSKMDENVLFSFISTHFFISECFKAIRRKLKILHRGAEDESPSAQIRHALFRGAIFLFLTNRFETFILEKMSEK